MDLSVYNVTLVISKKCGRCEGVFPIIDFSIDKSKKDGRSIYCYNCRKKISKAKRATNSHKQNRKLTRKRYARKERDYLLKSRYGITADQFDAIFLSQNNTCALCTSDKSDGKNFVVDHCHKTGNIRGILCSYCNRALGMFKDDPETLKQAIRYLEK